LEEEFDESTNAIRLELNRFEATGLLVSKTEGRKKMFKANPGHPLYPEIYMMMRKQVGLDRIIVQIIEKLGAIRKAYMAGDLARGKDATSIELVLVGANIDQACLEGLVRKTEALITRKIHYQVIRKAEEQSFLQDRPESLLIWDGGKRRKRGEREGY